MNHLDLFSGIGGFALATEVVWPDVTHTFVELDSFCTAVLRKHWPKATFHDDIKTYRGGSESVDLVTGGFPCQPFSLAGKRKGTDDDRDLWPEMFRVICEAKPRWVIGENVAGFIQMELERSVADLESAGYEVQAFVIPAAAVGAPHRRDRVWIVAHNAGWIDGPHNREPEERQKSQLGKSSGNSHDSDTDRNGRERFDGKNEIVASKRRQHALHDLGASRRDAPAPDFLESGGKRRIGGKGNGPQSQERILGCDDSDLSHSNPNGIGLEGRSGFEINKRPKSVFNPSRHSRRGHNWKENWTSVATRLCRMDDGLPKRVDRLKALGNAIVPQVAAEIMVYIKAVDESI